MAPDPIVSGRPTRLPSAADCVFEQSLRLAALGHLAHLDRDDLGSRLRAGRSAVEAPLDHAAHDHVDTGAPIGNRRRIEPGHRDVGGAVVGRRGHLQRQQTATGRQLSKYRIARQATLQEDDVHDGQPPTCRCRRHG